MNKKIYISVISFFIVTVSIPELEPTLGKLLDLSLEGELEFVRQRQECEKIWELVSNQNDYKNLSPEDKDKYENCDETYDSYWDVIGMGCSWYCGGGQDTLSATSFIPASKGIRYHAKNAHDLNYKTAWIEGAKGYGIGEILTFHFPPETPRITKIIIANGYVKTEKSWKENSRVKKLKLFISDKPIAFLNLKDVRQEQEFQFDPIGESDRDNYEILKTKPWWTMKFEIVEVYKGEKYADTAISEIYFDGIDVH